MNIPDLTEDDHQPILESFMPDWRNNWLTVDIAWGFYETFHSERLERAIKDYQR
jgi:hypothetical protein